MIIMTRLFHAAGATASSGILPNLHLGAGAGAALIRDVLSGNFEMDINRVSAALTILGFGVGAIRYGYAIGRRCADWVQQFFTACVTVTAPDELHDQVLRWLSDHVLRDQKTRLLSAKSGQHSKDQGGWPMGQPYMMGGRRRYDQGRESSNSSSSSIQYLPAYGTTWFFHERVLFAVTRSLKSSTAALPELDMGISGMYIAASSKNEEMLSIMCLGRSPEPIKAFLHQCRAYSRKLNKFTVSIRSCGEWGANWDLGCQKAARPMDTLYLDDAVKQDILHDIQHYAKASTREYYQRRGIPYRRGYLLHGPPGTGKTSLSLALAGRFKLDLYVLNMSAVNGDVTLSSMFNTLPMRCIVLLEDIDVVGIKREAASESDSGADSKPVMGGSRFIVAGPPPMGGSGPGSSRGCTLSGLLNVLDGVASQEGRIVLMTSNDPDSLDEALLRPGRIDRKYYLGNMKRAAVEAMFTRMFEPESPSTDDDRISSDDEGVECESWTDEEVEQRPRDHEKQTSQLLLSLEEQAREFAALVPEEQFSPAKLQGYLLMHSESAEEAIREWPSWLHEETRSPGKSKQQTKLTLEAPVRGSKFGEMAVLSRTQLLNNSIKVAVGV